MRIPDVPLGMIARRKRLQHANIAARQHTKGNTMETPTEKLKIWIAERAAFFRGLKSRTEQQELFLLLLDKPNRNSEEEKKLAALIRADRAAVRASKARSDVAKLLRTEKEKQKEEQRKARNHRLIQQGLLIDLAKLEGRSFGEILGLLLAGAATEDAQKWASWKAKGDALLAEKG